MTRPLCSAMLRIKNEDRWIIRVLLPLYKICDRIFVMDDHSIDYTRDMCRQFPNVVLLESPFDTLDESRDKNWLYDQILNHPEYQQNEHGYHWPEWLICIDGDEVIIDQDVPRLIELFHSDLQALKFRVIYLWNNERTWRTDGVYKGFSRPSAFRIINPAFRFQSTPWGNGANFHCSSIPQELIFKAQPTEVRILHYGYMFKEDRMRKWDWYNSIDPQNPSEGWDARYPERRSYPWIVQGDVPQVPAHVRLQHAGPLELKPL